MKQILATYYELDVIPSLVLACLCGLGWFVGEGDVSLTRVAGAFLFFLVVMTIESVWNTLKEIVDVLDKLDSRDPLG
jgi:hypothetical protein